MEYFLGIDLGGTAAKIGITDKDGNIVAKGEYKSNVSDNPDELVKYFGECVNDLINKSNVNREDIKGAGIGAPGLLNPETGQLYFVTNLQILNNYYLADELSKHINMPVFLDNDVNAMALAELYYGAAKGYKHVIAITLGTGIGGGIIIDGRLYRGATFTAGELGHIPVSAHGHLCNCGSYGCIERYAARDGIIERFKAYYEHKEMKSNINEFLDNGEITPKAIAMAAMAGDSLAKQVYDEVGTLLGITLGSLVNVLNPEIIVVGGGIANAGDLILEPARKEMMKRAYSVPAQAVKVVQAKLKNDAGIVGSASIAVSMLKN